VTPILELEIRLESALAHGARGVHRREKANLVIGLGRVPFSKTLNVDIFCVSAAFARGDKRIVLRVLFIEAHVTNRVVGRRDLAAFGGVGGGILERVLRIFWSKATNVR
jgi:hypothetical protein